MDDSTAREVMERDGIDPLAISIFERQIERVRSGEPTMISDAEIEPYEAPPMPAADGIGSLGRGGASLDGILDRVAVIRLNGGMATSMGLDRAKSLLPVRGEQRFLDLIVDQVLAVRESSGARLPITFLHSFRTSRDCLAALRVGPSVDVPPIPIEVLQNRVPRLHADTLEPVSWPADRSLEWCPPGHGDLYTVLYTTGLLDALATSGFDVVFVANADNLGAVPDAGMAAWFASTGAPFAIEVVRRSDSDRKGGHVARRRRDGRLILRETAQTPAADLTSIDQHRFSSTNNLWFRIDSMRERLRSVQGDLRLPVISNQKRVVPGDETTPEVVQLETAMGAAIEAFDDATTVEVGRDRFIPVKTTDDLLVVRSDCFRLDERHRLVQVPEALPLVTLGTAYRHLADLDRLFPMGAPSLRAARSLEIRGEWTFGGDVTVVGDVVLGPGGGRVPDGAVLDGDRS